MNWILENKEWIFSGIGVPLLTAWAVWLARRVRTVGHQDEKRKALLVQKTGKHSKNIQAGGDVQIHIRKKS